MTHKETCSSYVKEHLQNLSLDSYWNQLHFNHYYRKHGGSKAHPYWLALSAADYIIYEATRQTDQTSRRA